MEAERNEVPAHPLLGFQLLENPDQPTLAMIAFETEAGPSLFTVTKEILEELSDAFRRLAEKMADENNLN